MLTDFDKDSYNESSNIMRFVRSEAQTPDSNQSTVDENESIDHSLFDDDDRKDSPPSIISMSTGRSRNPSGTQFNDGAFSGSAFSGSAFGGSAFSGRNCGSYRSLDRLSRVPGRVSVWNEKMTKKIPPPFCGSISSQLLCSSCSHKSVVRVDKFDSITLNLPEGQRSQSLLSLGQLLGDYVAPENGTYAYSPFISYAVPFFLQWSM